MCRIFLDSCQCYRLNFFGFLNFSDKTARTRDYAAESALSGESEIGQCLSQALSL